MVGAKVNGKLVPAERELQNAGGCRGGPCLRRLYGIGVVKVELCHASRQADSGCVPSHFILPVNSCHLFCPVLPAEVVEVVHYKGPINATIIRRHQQWLDAAQVGGLG